jgi:tetratricopeptide (TPR) repeat protein
MLLVAVLELSGREYFTQSNLFEKKWRGKMDNNKKLFEGLLKADGINPAGATEPERIAFGKMLDQQSKSKLSKLGSRPDVWRIIMKSTTTKVATAAVIIIAVLVSISLLDKNVTTAYAIEQTIEAFNKVHFLHLIRHNETGEIEDERWIEINPDGTQGRYRQDTSGKLLVVDNGENSFVYRRDKNAVLLYGENGPKYTWISNLHEFFQDMAGDNSVTIEKNTEYNGRRAHLVRWLKLNVECYIDPESKLPIALGRDEIYYDEPGENIFQMPEIPEIATVVDKRPGATETEEPEWVKNEKDAQKNFDAARVALANGQSDEAVKLFKEVFQLEGTDRNWAWFWLGQAYDNLGKYDAAIEAYTKVIEMFKRYNITPHYAHLARGFAYRAQGMEESAWADFRIALPIMIDALRNIKGAKMFDYADDPLNRGKEYSDPQRFDKMVSRLQLVAGKDYVYSSNIDKENTILFWEQWWNKAAPK